MLALIKSFGLKGLDGFPVQAEIDMHSGMPSYDIVGLADTAVKESRERVRSAMKNSGYKYPVASVVVNLAPADVKKEGSLYDLPIAVGMLAASKQIPYDSLKSAIGNVSQRHSGRVRFISLSRTRFLHLYVWTAHPLERGPAGVWRGNPCV